MVIFSPTMGSTPRDKNMITSRKSVPQMSSLA